MSKIIGSWIADGAIDAQHLASGATSSVLSSKLQAMRTAVLNKSVSGSSSDVSTEVLAAATTDTPRTALTAKGIYTGAVASAVDSLRVMIRAAGTDNGIDDGTGDDVYAALSEATGVYTLSFKKANGAAFTFSTSTAIDFYFVEIFDLDSMPVDAVLRSGSVSGVVDAGSADIAAQALSAITVHTNGTAGRHNDTEIEYTRNDGLKKNIQASSDAVSGAINDLDDKIGTIGTPTNYTPTEATVAGHLAGVDSALAAAGGTSFNDSTFEVKNTATPTKKMVFDVSGVSASSTATLSVSRSADTNNIVKTITEKLTINATDITNKYKDLTVAANAIRPADTSMVQPKSGPVQFYADDYTIVTDGSFVRRVNWSGLGLDGQIKAGDILSVSYQVNG